MERLLLALGVAASVAAGLDRDPSTVLIPATAGPMGGFGTSVAAEGDLLVAGSPREHRALVYRLNGQSRTWVETCKLRASDERVGFFGYSCAITGVRVFVAARTAKPEGRGAVHVFDVGPDGCSHAATLQPEELETNACFGWAVDASSALLAIGTPNQNAMDGAVWVYDLSTLKQIAVVHAPTAGSRSRLGGAVAAWGRRVLVVATDECTAYLYEVAEDGTVRFVTKVHHEGGDFGYAVDLGDRMLAVGAPTEQGGAVYVYREGKAGWDLETKLLAPKDDHGFGYSISISGDEMLVGDVGMNGAGGAMIYRKGEGGWKLEARLVGTQGSGAGFSVCLSGKTAFVGAPARSEAGELAGSVMVFSGVGE